MEVDPVQGSILTEVNPSRKEKRRIGAGRGDRHPNNGVIPGRGSSGAMAPQGSSTAPGTAAGER